MFWDGAPNVLAYLAFLAFPVVIVVLFTRMRPHIAAAYSLLGGVLFLPEVLEFDLPVIPPLNKGTITAFCVLLAMMWKAPQRLSAARAFRGFDFVFVLALFGNVMTSITNGDAIVTGPVVRPALSLYDAFAGSVKDTLGIWLPYFLARSICRTPEELAELVRITLRMAIAYSFFCLFEARFSPQLHRWVYGYHAADFSMTLRGGGYRPTVFMLHGLAVANFVLSGTMLSITQWKLGKTKARLAAYLAVALALCRSSGALVYAVFFLPLMAFVKKPRFVLPLILGVLVLTFPILRGTGTVPTEWIVEKMEAVFGEERALSLWFRFDNEDTLLERARERIWFGWGGYDRNRVFDPVTGEDMVITDGDWMIQLGVGGAVGFVGRYALLVLPLFVLYRKRKQIRDRKQQLLYAGWAMIAGLNALELLPNGLFSWLPYFYSGVLAGAVSAIGTARAVIPLRPRGPAARAQQRASLAPPMPKQGRGGRVVAA
ncbi:membrane protein [Sandaracinus amylolyticus]|uniref:Membrane protein n=2 Tax=Sandaracinus amylolyticus TaxID=927083 RepID=A0A0F6W7F0_9BACT|nr:membrane protein [Sandaracinus amylolyticus]